MFFKTCSYIKICFHVTAIIITTLRFFQEDIEKLNPESLEYIFFSKERNRDIEIKRNKFVTQSQYIHW